MYCPACSSQAKDEQKFCRACGFNLQPIIPLVGTHEQAPKVPEKVRRVLKKIEYLGIGIGGSGFALIVGTGIFILLALSFLGPEVKSTMGPIWNKVFGVGLLMILQGVFLFAVPWLLKEFFPFKSSRQVSLDPAKTKELLPEPPPEAIASITEQTTRNLEPILEERAKPSASSELTHHI
jgi:hypothetical protein